MKIILVEKDDLVIEELFHVNWDNTLVFQKILTSPPSTSALGNSYNEIKPIIAPYRFRVSEDGNKIAILSNDPKYQSDKDHNMEFILYDLKSKKLSKTKLPLNESPVGKVEVIDFMIMDNGMFYLLDRVYINEKTNTDRLRLIQPDGIVVWEVKCNNADDATFQNGAFIGKCTGIVKITEKYLFVQSEEAGKTSVFKINVKTGNVEKWMSLDNKDLRVFIDDNLHVYYLSFIKEANNRAYTEYDPEFDKRNIQFVSPDIYPIVTFPVAMDNRRNIYCAEGFSLSCLEPALNLKWTLPINNIVIDSGNLFLSFYNESNSDLSIYEWTRGGVRSEITHINLSGGGAKLSRLLGLTKSGDFVIETFRQNNKLIESYNMSTGKLEELSKNRIFEFFHLQSADTWQIDKVGDIYLPVTSDEGLHIIKIYSGHLI